MLKSAGALLVIVTIPVGVVAFYQKETRDLNHASQTSTPAVLTDAQVGITNGLYDDLPTQPSTTAKAGLYDDLIPKAQLPDFGPETTLPNGLPAGAWASTLEPVALHPGLFRDPATHKLCRIENGKIFEETDTFADLSPEMRLNVARIQLEMAQRHAEEAADFERRQAELAERTKAINAYYDAKQQQSVDTYNASVAERTLPSPVVVSPLPTSFTSYDPNSIANPYGAGSPYKADGLMNPYSQYGSPYSSKSWRNPYATDTPKLYDSQGNYRGKLSSNPYDPDSTANPYGRYGSKYSPDSINNPYGLGSPYNTQPIYVVPSP